MMNKDLGSRFDELQRALDLHREYLDSETDAEPFLEIHEPLRHLLAPLISHGSIDLAPRPTRVLGGYQLLREIGRGAMGEVFEAKQTALGRRVAVKVLPPQIVHRPTALERFKREARVVAQLDHPSIARVHDAEEHEGIHYFAMDFIEGASLDHVLRILSDRPVANLSAADLRKALQQSRNTNQPPDLHGSDEGTRIDWQASYLHGVAAIGIQLADALHHAHQRDVIHRDVKPSNVMLQESGRVVLTDFGLAQEISSVGLTATGDPLGTPSYASPEQLSMNQIPVDHRADVFSLGVSLYELATLHRPFEADDIIELKKQILTKEPKRPQKYHPTLPRDLSSILLCAIEKDADRRYGSMADFAEDLRRFCTGKPVLARPISTISRTWRWCRRNPRISSAIFVQSLAVALLGIAIFFVENRARAATTARTLSQFDSILSIGQEAPFNRTTQLEIAYHHQQRCKALGVPLYSPNTKLLRALDLSQVAVQWQPGAFPDPGATEHATNQKLDAHPLGSDLDLAILGSAEGPLYVADLTKQINDDTKPERYRRTSLEGHEGRSFGTLASHSEIALSAGMDNTIRLWNHRTGEQLDIHATTHPATVIRVSPTGDYGLTIHTDGSFWLYNLENRSLRPSRLAEDRLHDGDLLDAEFSPDGKHLVTATMANHPGETHFVRRAAWRLWKLDPFEEVQVDTSIRSSAVQRITWQPDGKRFVLSIADTVYIVPVNSDSLTEVADFGDTVLWAGVSELVPQRIVALLDGENPWIMTYDLWSQERTPFSRTERGLPFAAISPSGKDLAVATHGHGIHCFDLQNGKRTSFPTSEQPAYLRWNRSGTQIASAGTRSAQAFFYSRNFMQTLAHPRAVLTLKGAFHPHDTDQCLTTADDGVVRLWDLDNPRDAKHILSPLPPPKDPRLRRRSPVLARYSPSGDQIATGSADGRLTLWRFDGAMMWQNNSAHTGRILELQYLQNGAQLVTISADGVGKVWDSETREPIRDLDLPEARSTSIAQPATPPKILFATVHQTRDLAAVITETVDDERTLTVIDLGTGRASWSRSWETSEVGPTQSNPAVTAIFGANGGVWITQPDAPSLYFHPFRTYQSLEHDPVSLDRILNLDSDLIIGAEHKTGRLTLRESDGRQTWSSETGLASLVVPLRPIVDLALQPPGSEPDERRFLAATWGTKDVLVIDIRNRRLHARLEHKTPVTSCTFDSLGQHILTTHRFGARVWPLHPDREIRRKQLRPTRLQEDFLDKLLGEIESAKPESTGK